MTSPREGYIHSAVGSILRLARDARKTPYPPEEAQACFGAIENAARELYESLGLGQDTQTEDTLPPSAVAALETHRRQVTIVRSKIDRARAYIREGKLEDALKALNGAVQTCTHPACQPARPTSVR